MSRAQPLIRLSLSQQIRDHLLGRIVSGTLKPGDRLVELKIADEMATSQAPVREALRELEAIGVVETLRNKGARVRTISDHELGEIYDVRAQLEGYAAELAAGAGAPIKGKLMESVKRMKQAARKGDSIAFAEHNTAFHRRIVESAGNSFLLGVWESLDVKVRTAVNVARSNRDLLEIAESHVAIVDAITSGNCKSARTKAARHVLNNRPRPHSTNAK